jgi:2-methylisocitrate lyase-like PEP mutase family enzyme
VPIVINGRTDEFLLGERRLDEAIARGRAYLDAGADCFFVPGLIDLGDTRRLVEELDGAPVNVLAIPASPPLTELAAAQVARVSFGPGPMGVAYAALGGAAADLLAMRGYPPGLAHRPGG